MSYTVNGIGTHIHGRQRLLTRRGQCQTCGAHADLQSYDGTTYFVIGFIPIFPLYKLRVLDHCSVCQRWRQLKLKDWEQQKEQVLSKVLARLKQNPRDPDAIREALEASASFQDEAILLQFKGLAADFPQESALQSALANCLSLFSRHEEAVEALERALATHDCQETREQLAVELLRMGEVTRAEACLSHIWSGEEPDSIGLGILLVEGYQAAADNEAALSRLDRLAQTYPQLADDKDFRKFRQNAEKYRQKGTVVQETRLVSRSKKGFDPTGDPATLAPYIAPVLAALVLSVYCGYAAWKGRHREVFLVNGLDQSYTAMINGKPQSVDAHGLTRISLVEGDVVVSVEDPSLAIPEHTVRIATPFLGRPFANRTFVLNPDRLALIASEEVLYGKNNLQREPEYHIAVGEPFYEFTGIDYAFQEAPDEITTKSGVAVRDALRHVNTSHWRGSEVVDELLSSSGPEVARAYLLRRLELHADSTSCVAGLRRTMPAGEYLNLVKTRLDEKPTSVAWHLAFQDIMQREQPEYGLKQEYRSRLQNDPRDSALLYLLARITLRPVQRADLLHRATQAKPAVSYAFHGLALEHLANGRFKDGISTLRNALELSPRNEAFRETQRELFVADGQYDFALTKCRDAEGVSLVAKLNLLASRILLRVAMGEAETAQREIVEAMQEARAEFPEQVEKLIENTFKETMAYAMQDWQSFRALHPNPSPENSPFHVLLTLGRYRDASAALDEQSMHEEHDELGMAAAYHLLVYIAATDNQEPDLADEHLSKATELLSTTGVHGQMVARALSTGKADMPTLVAYPGPPSIKRIVMVACTRRFPSEARAYAAMAEKLNFELLFPRWFLESALKKINYAHEPLFTAPALVH